MHSQIAVNNQNFKDVVYLGEDLQKNIRALKETENFIHKILPINVET